MTEDFEYQITRNDSIIYLFEFQLLLYIKKVLEEHSTLKVPSLIYKFPASYRMANEIFITIFITINYVLKERIASP